MHHGIDIAVPSGTTLSSTVAGTVVFAGEGKSGSGYGGYGNVVAIRDNQGNVHVFGHLDSVGLKVGQQVGRGTDIGRSGNTGTSTGAHLHYEVRKNGELYNTVDPTSYLQGSGAGRSQTQTQAPKSTGWGPSDMLLGAGNGKAYQQAPLAVRKVVDSAAKQHGVSASLISAIIQAESNFKTNAKSHAGATGLMQLMPNTAKGLGVLNPLDPQQNVNGGTQYIKSLLQRYPDARLALAAYNWGLGNVDKALKKYGNSYEAIEKHMPKETRDYVPKVLGFI